MNKIIKLSLVFCLLFSSMTHHKKAEASVTEVAGTVVITSAALLGLYFLIKAFSESTNIDDTPETLKLKRGAGKGVSEVNKVAKTLNGSIDKNFGVNIGKYVDKTANVISDTTGAIGQTLDNTLLTPEQRGKKFVNKSQQKVAQILNGQKDPISGGLELLKDGFNALKNELEIAQ
jgi:hypothetical protein